jgi:hypothetical protein
VSFVLLKEALLIVSLQQDAQPVSLQPAPRETGELRYAVLMAVKNASDPATIDSATNVYSEETDSDMNASAAKGLEQGPLHEYAVTNGSDAGEGNASTNGSDAGEGNASTNGTDAGEGNASTNTSDSGTNRTGKTVKTVTESIRYERTTDRNPPEGTIVSDTNASGYGTSESGMNVSDSASNSNSSRTSQVMDPKDAKDLQKHPQNWQPAPKETRDVPYVVKDRPMAGPWTQKDQQPIDDAKAEARDLGQANQDAAAKAQEESAAALKKITDHAQQVQDDAADEMSRTIDAWSHGESLPEDDAIKDGFPVMGPEFYTLKGLMLEMTRKPVPDAAPQQLLISGRGTFMASTASHAAVPLSTGNNIRFATVFTKPEPQHRLPGPQGWDWAVDNAGARYAWNGYRTKIEAMQDWVSGLDDEQLVVYMDGGDVMYGGCSSDDLLERFNTISKATKASIIFGAEYNCYEPPSAGCDNYPGQGRDKVLEAFNLNADSLDTWGMDQVSNSGLSSAAFHHMALKYLNSGFYM